MCAKGNIYEGKRALFQIILNYFGGASQVAMDNLADRSDKLAEVMGVMHSGFTSAFRTMNEKFGEPRE